MSFSNLVKGTMAVCAVASVAVAAVAATIFLIEEEEYVLPEGEKPVFNIMPGDMVQWEQPDYGLIFPQPKKVLRLEKSDMGTYVFVEGSSCGIPLTQIVPMS